MKLEKGLIHVYTGEGKGKTSAALGLAMRAAGRGLNVLVLQYFKPAAEPSGELAFQEALRTRAAVDGGEPGHLVFRRGGYRHPFFDKNADREALRVEIQEQTALAAAEMRAGHWDVVVLDEVNNALRDRLLLFEELEALLEARPPHVELVCTGRGAPKELLEAADYATEFTALKHPASRKIAARKGIEF